MLRREDKSRTDKNDKFVATRPTYKVLIDYRQIIRPCFSEQKRIATCDTYFEV